MCFRSGAKGVLGEDRGGGIDPDGTGEALKRNHAAVEAPGKTDKIATQGRGSLGRIDSSANRA